MSMTLEDLATPRTWEVNGKTYTIKPLTLGQLAMISERRRSKDRDQIIADAKALGMSVDATFEKLAAMRGPNATYGITEEIRRITNNTDAAVDAIMMATGCDDREEVEAFDQLIVMVEMLYDVLGIGRQSSEDGGGKQNGPPQ